MKKKLSVLVAGAAGHQGGAVANALLNKGHNVCALTRKPNSNAAQQLIKEGADVIEGSFEDSELLSNIMKDVDAVFAVTTPSEEGMIAEILQGRRLANAAFETNVKHFLFSSVYASDQNTDISFFDSKYQIEQHIKLLKLPYTIIRPVFFMENFFGPSILPGLQQDKVELALPASRNLQQIAVPNIGEFAVIAFEQRSQFIGKTIDLASDELTGDQVSNTLSHIIGRRIQYNEIPLNQLTLENPDYWKMYDWFNRVGCHVDINKLRHSYPEIRWLNFEEWAKLQDWTVLNQPVLAK